MASSSTLHKLLRKPPLPPFPFLNSIHPLQQSQNPILTTHLLHQPSPTSPPPPPTPQHRFVDAAVIFPSFPFGFSPTPVSEIAFRFSPDDHAADVEEEKEDSGSTVWADSVKKKRKRKMNKHKYQKLRKRMRRQS